MLFSVRNPWEGVNLGDLIAQLRGLPEDLKERLLAELEKLKDLISEQDYLEAYKLLLQTIYDINQNLDKLKFLLDHLDEMTKAKLFEVLDRQQLYNEIVEALIQLITYILMLCWWLSGSSISPVSSLVQALAMIAQGLGQKKLAFALELSSVSSGNVLAEIECFSNVIHRVSKTKAYYGKSRYGTSYYDPEDIRMFAIYDPGMWTFTKSLQEAYTRIAAFSDKIQTAHVENQINRASRAYTFTRFFIGDGFGFWNDSAFPIDAYPQYRGYWEFGRADVSTVDEDPKEPPDVDQPLRYWYQPTWGTGTEGARVEAPSLQEAPYLYIPYRAVPNDAIAVSRTTSLNDVMYYTDWDEGIWENSNFAMQEDDLLPEFKFDWAWSEPQYEVAYKAVSSSFRVNATKDPQVWNSIVDVTRLEEPFYQPSTKLYGLSQLHMSLIEQRASKVLDELGVTSPYQRNLYIDALKQLYRWTSQSHQKGDLFFELSSLEEMLEKLVKKWEADGLDPNIMKELIDRTKDYVLQLSAQKLMDTLRNLRYKIFVRSQT